MKLDQISNLYLGLTNKERAALSFRYIMDSNDLELTRVTDTIEFKNYRCHDAEYRCWVQSYFTLASLWGLMYWQNTSRLMASIALGYANSAGLLTDDILAINNQVTLLKRRALSLNLALIKVCEAHSLDHQAVLKYADVETGDLPDTELLPDMAYLDELVIALGVALKIA